MITVICGGRYYVERDIDWAVLDLIRDEINISAVVCGLATGGDEVGRRWAIDRGIPVYEFPAKWRTFGKKAGFLRNLEMAEVAEAVVAFPGGRGTAHMVGEGRRRGLLVIDLTEV